MARLSQMDYLDMMSCPICNQTKEPEEFNLLERRHVIDHILDPSGDGLKRRKSLRLAYMKNERVYNPILNNILVNLQSTAIREFKDKRGKYTHIRSELRRFCGATRR